MASLGKLYGSPEHPLVKRVLAAAALAGVHLDIAPDYDHESSRTTLEFKSKFPAAMIPALEGPDGFFLSETSAIQQYIALNAPNSTLLGSGPREQALVEQWLSYIRDHINTHHINILYLKNSWLPYNKPMHSAATEKLVQGLVFADKHLATRTFLVNERITLADISLAGIAQYTFSFSVGSAERAKFPNLVRFVETVVQHPKLKTIFGPTDYSEKAFTYVAPSKDKKEKAPKTEKAAAAPAGKVEKVKAAVAAVVPKALKKKEEDPEEEDDLIPKEEPKAKNPLDSLPKSTFNLEDWKRAYSNMDTRGTGGSIEWFYNKFDPEGFSIWRVDFKYNDELTQTFMSSNQIGGFFNRLEASRKYLFGSVGVLGKPNDSVISGVFIARGSDIKPVIDVAPDWESYSYQQVDLKDEAQKKFFEAALAWDLELDGKAWADGKNFK